MRAGAIGTAIKPGNVCGHELSLTCSECRWAPHDCLLDVKPMAEGLRMDRVDVLDKSVYRHRRHERHGQFLRIGFDLARRSYNKPSSDTAVITRIRHKRWATVLWSGHCRSLSTLCEVCD